MPWWRPFTLAPDPNPIVFHALILATVGFVVIVVVAHIVIAVLAPRDANARADERERLIGLKATRIGAYVYAGLSLSSIFIIHLGANEIGLAYFLCTPSRSPRPSTTLRGSSTTVAGSGREPNHDHEFDSAATLRAQRNDAARLGGTCWRHPSDHQRDRARQIFAVARGGVSYCRGIRCAARGGVLLRRRQRPLDRTDLETRGPLDENESPHTDAPGEKHRSQHRVLSEAGVQR